ncbi:protein spaetzle 4 [Lucilia cuprina]|uniref:protein spaetzle 4 n=1 Tax=Lucilia cuprina TaxID=7375 RepID=UPI001F058F8D|nr:protein spaetzle 4 [Lucilia cuprina]
MDYINMDKRFKISKILIGNLIFLLLFAHTIDETSSFGFDSATSCSPNAKQSRRGRAQMLAAIPCDLTTQAYCNLPGAAYPWHAVRRFVHENQGLMKRMYGDVRHISVLRDEIINNEIDVEDIELAAERYSRDGYNRRASKFMHNREDFDNFKTNDVLREPHFRPVTTTTTTTTTTTKTPISTTEKLETTTDNSELEKTTNSEAETKLNPSNVNATTNNELNQKVENNFKSKLLQIDEDPDSELTTKTDLEKELEGSDTTVEDEEDEDVNIEFNSVYETPNETTAPEKTSGDNIEIVDSPQLGLTNITIDPSVHLTTTTKTESSTSSPTTTTTAKTTTTTIKPETVAERAPFKQRKPFIPSSQRQRPSQQLHKVDSTISAKLKLKTNPTSASPSRLTTTTSASTSNNETKTAETSSSTTPLTSTKTSPFKSHLNKNYNRYTTHNNRYALPTTSPPGPQLLTPTVQPFKSNPELLLGEKIRKPVASATPSVSAAGGLASNKPVLKDSQLFQDTMKQEAPASAVNARGVNACPVKEEVVAPFWANNTRGEVLALLNLYPFEQYVHWEKCTHEHKQMYCREGCRCEQQYRLHRLLAYDPHNECRGIFSDWFRFPSCCICKCYNIPLDFRATSRSPRSESGTSDYRHPIEVAEEQVKNAIYEHATEEWYRPKDEFDFYEG